MHHSLVGLTKTKLQNHLGHEKVALSAELRAMLYDSRLGPSEHRRLW